MRVRPPSRERRVTMVVAWIHGIGGRGNERR
nr:MAG TPA: hypothetical protein [Caudoviricetes sp.]